MSKLTTCPDCGVEPAQPHQENCDVEKCSVCGCQRLMDNCEGHDPLFARWTGIWPGSAEAAYLGTDLNGLYEQQLNKVFFVKPEEN